jgi:hypothetical protein
MRYSLEVSTAPKLTSANVRAFLARPWEELAALKESHWRDALLVDPLATFRASEALWELLHEQGHTVDEAERRADFEAHRRLRALLDRTANVSPR